MSTFAGIVQDPKTIDAWLRLYASKPHTEWAYRKEAKRLLFWSIYAHQHKPFSSLTTQDVADYVQFLAQLGTGWDMGCGSAL